MLKQMIHDNWKMHMAGSDNYFPAKVPGTVCSDLLAAGVIEDPYYRDNETKVLKVLENDFENGIDLILKTGRASHGLI